MSQTKRVAMLSYHTSPLATPGSSDAGGMNVYVSSLARALGQCGFSVDIFTRRTAPWDRVTELSDGVRVVPITAGPLRAIDKSVLPDHIGEFVEAVARHFDREGLPDIIHANYWMSAVAGQNLKWRTGRPLAVTFHTLGLVKERDTAAAESAQRILAEGDIVGCADLLLASTQQEADDLAGFYGADPGRVRVMPPGVDAQLFHPGSRQEARRLLGLGDGPVALFVGRIQPLKGLQLAVQGFASAGVEGSTLVVVGGPSGPDGQRELETSIDLARQLGVLDQIDWRPPQAHEDLGVFYRAADLCLVPSYSESFGLVALEAGASGIPVVASAVGGLKRIIVDRISGRLLPTRDPREWGRVIRSLFEDPAARTTLADAAWLMSSHLTWDATARRLAGSYGTVIASDPVDCREPQRVSAGVKEDRI
ncbi:MAG: glycosyltransferase [Acidimicrobiia bacterium]|nr:glycosyltransferase [Acidimicrobiia bacterium]MBP8179892.1 glycosyltransferase [Acidimicrobiia bacterium]